eukprot:COSAG01_NODE_1733_length_9368_cov_6.908620_1_plen_150_part_00
MSPVRCVYEPRAMRTSVQGRSKSLWRSAGASARCLAKRQPGPRQPGPRASGSQVPCQAAARSALCGVPAPFPAAASLPLCATEYRRGCAPPCHCRCRCCMCRHAVRCCCCCRCCCSMCRDVACAVTCVVTAVTYDVCRGCCVPCSTLSI